MFQLEAVYECFKSALNTAFSFMRYIILAVFPTLNLLVKYSSL